MLYPHSNYYEQYSLNGNCLINNKLILCFECDVLKLRSKIKK